MARRFKPPYNGKRYLGVSEFQNLLHSQKKSEDSTFKRRFCIGSWFQRVEGETLKGKCPEKRMKLKGKIIQEIKKHRLAL